MDAAIVTDAAAVSVCHCCPQQVLSGMAHPDPRAVVCAGASPDDCRMPYCCCCVVCAAAVLCWTLNPVRYQTIDQGVHVSRACMPAAHPTAAHSATSTLQLCLLPCCQQTCCSLAYCGMCSACCSVPSTATQSAPVMSWCRKPTHPLLLDHVVMPPAGCWVHHPI